MDWSAGSGLWWLFYKYKYVLSFDDDDCRCCWWLMLMMMMMSVVVVDDADCFNNIGINAPTHNWNVCWIVILVSFHHNNKHNIVWGDVMYNWFLLSCTIMVSIIRPQRHLIVGVWDGEGGGSGCGGGGSEWWWWMDRFPIKKWTESHFVSKNGPTIFKFSFECFGPKWW